jgi:1-acyl-sn-glycerol-3-phosphate acyltransferase
MSKPAVTLPNAPEMYEYYGARGPSMPVARTIHALSSLAFHPDITSDEGALVSLRETLDDKSKRVVLSCNHQSNWDSVELAGIVQRVPEMRPMIGHTRIFSKPSFFRYPIMRTIFDGIGAIPVFRKKDILRAYGDDPAGITDSRKARDALISITVKRMVEYGEDLAGYFEGERNTEDITQVLDLQPGVIKVFKGVLQSNVQPVVFAVATNYQNGLRVPRVHISKSYEPEFANKSNWLADMKQQLQDSLKATK